MSSVWWLALIVLLAGPLRQPMESSMALHMLLQLPLLGVAGWQLWPRLQARLAPVLLRWDQHGIAALLTASLTVMIWMVPRSLDAALSEPRVDAAKFVSVIVLAGMAMRWSWPRLSIIIRGVVWSNLIAMLLVMSWLYLMAPMRVCVNYGTAQQTLAGYGFLAAAVALSLWLTASLFFVQSGTSSAREPEDRAQLHCPE